MKELQNFFEGHKENLNIEIKMLLERKIWCCQNVICPLIYVSNAIIIPSQETSQNTSNFHLEEYTDKISQEEEMKKTSIEGNMPYQK